MPGEFIFRIALTIFVIVVLVIILARSRKGKFHDRARDSLDIMKERYEKGEISKEDYEEAKRRRGKS